MIIIRILQPSQNDNNSDNKLPASQSGKLQSSQKANLNSDNESLPKQNDSTNSEEDQTHIKPFITQSQAPHKYNTRQKGKQSKK